MRRDTANVLLLLFSAALTKLALTDAHLRFVKPSLQPYLLASALVIGALAVLSLVRDVLRGRPAHDDHGHEHGGRSLWLLLLPILALVLVLPAPLGADKVRRSANVDPAQQSYFSPLEPGVNEMPFSEFVVRARWDQTGTLIGREVLLTGFIVHDDDHTLLARLAISCCAADAQPFAVELESDDDDLADQIDDLRQDTWWRARIELQPNQDPDARPLVEVRELQPIPAPSNPYES